MPYKSRIVLTILGLALAAGAAGAQEMLELPEQLTYLVFVAGEPAGRTNVTAYREGDILVLESDSEIEAGFYQHALSCRTEADVETLESLSFVYKGQINHTPATGHIWTRGDSIFGETVLADVRDPSFMWSNMYVLFLQDFVVEHQILCANAVFQEGGLYRRFMALVPSTFKNLESIGTLESELALEGPRGTIVARKYRITYSGRPHFFVFFDARSRLPVYLQYPDNLVEFFLVEAFGPEPDPQYRFYNPKTGK